MTDAIAMFAAGIAALALVVAAVSALYAYRQAAAAERQAIAGEKTLQFQSAVLRSQAEDTAKALEIAKRNADATERLAEANEALAISGQRGWFVIERQGGSVNNLHISGKDVIQLHLSVKFVNAGKTPVSDVRIRYCSRILDERPRDYAEGCYNEHQAVVAPGADVSIAHSIICTPDEHRALAPGQKTAYFYGNVSYKDVFGYGRHTYWCYMHDAGRFIPTDSDNKFD